MERILKAEYYAPLKIGSAVLNVGVLEDETRVISQRSLAIAFGIRGGGAYWQKKKTAEGGTLLPEYLSANYLLPFISKSLHNTLKKSITYKSKSGAIATGYEASVLPEICDVWIKAKDKGALTESQERIALNAYEILKGFATVGIIALIDEVTGYQKIRRDKALQEILDKYLLKEYSAWAKRFPIEFYEEIHRLKNWKLDKRTMKMTPLVGRFTNDIVYDRLAPGILSELKRLNPMIEGKRKVKHHQYLTTDVGHPALNIHLNSVMALMRANTTWEGFKRGLERAYPRIGSQLALRFIDENE